MLMFFSTEDFEMLSILVEHHVMKTDIIVYYFSTISKELKRWNQK